MTNYRQQTGLLNRFLMNYPNKSTKRLYKQSLTKYFKYHYGEDCDLPSVVDQYFQSERDWELDLVNYYTEAIPLWSPKYLALQRAAIRLFLEEYEIIIPKRTWRRLAKQKPVYTIQEDRLPTKEELKQIFNHLPLNGKAVFFIMLSAGTVNTDYSYFKKDLPKQYFA